LDSYRPAGRDAEVHRIELWSLREDVLVETGSSGGVVLLTRWGEVRVKHPDPTILESLRRMSLGPVSLENVVEAGEGPAQQRLAKLLDTLQYAVVRSLGLEDGTGPLLSVVPMTRQARFAPAPVPLNRTVRLSRMATLRSEENALVLESPLAAHRVVLHHPTAAAVVAALGAPRTLDAVAAALALPAGLVADIAGHVIATGMAAVAEPGVVPRFTEETDPVLRRWAHHELLFHALSRAGRGDAAVSVEDAPAPAEPVVKEPPPGPRLRLFRPEYAALVAADPTLTVAVEARRSYRRFGSVPVTAEQLGELLYRCARLRALRPGEGRVPEASDRPYPSLRGQHELELYVVVDDECVGVPRAIHHYDPRDHMLTVVNVAEKDVGELLETARIGGGMTSRPPVLIVITARFGRLSRRRGDAYAAILRHVGALQQTLHLVATAMGLAPCAVSAEDDDDHTVRALRLDWRAESDVGEFAFGARPVPPPPDPPGTPVNDADWSTRSRSEIGRCR
jgi:SagB-type dehydrogenase family enzyme